MPCTIQAIRVFRVSRAPRVSRFVRLCLPVMLCSLAATAPVLAQATATLTGSVMDDSGAVIPNATVVATNLATMLDRQTATSRDGQFTVPLLSPGRYLVHVQRDGFTPIEVPELVLNVNDTVAIRVQMKVAAIGESVTVVPEPPRINTSAGVSTVIDRQRMEGLPMLNRSTLSLAELVPGVATVTMPQAVIDQRQGPTISAMGSRSDQVNVQLDGAQLAASLSNTVQNLPSPDSIQEFKVLTNSYSAEYGRASGATLLAITKSGTQTLRAGLWEYFRDDALNAANYFAPSKPVLRQNQFGGNLGGPLFRDRTFFFASYEGLRIRQETIVRFSSPTAAQRAGDFSASSAPIIDPDTGQPFPGNHIPRARLDPMALNFLDAYVPSPNDGTQVNTLAARPTDGDQLTVKIDHQLAAGNTATVRWYRSKTEGVRTAGVEALNTPQQNLVDSWTISDTHVFGASLVGEGRISFTAIETSSPTAPGSLSPRELGAVFDQDGATPQAPNVSVSGAFSSFTILPWLERSRMAGFDYKMSWIAGGHALKFGVQHIRQSQHEVGPYQSSGTFGFTGNFTGNPLADFMLGRPGSFVQAGRTDRLAKTRPWSAFVQDDVRLGRVTVNLGVPLDRFVPWEQTDRRAAIFRPGQQSTRFPSAPPGLVVPGDPGIPDGVVPHQTRLAPRVGFAWDVTGDGRTAVRAAFGRFTAADPSINATQVNGNAPFTPTVSLVPQSFRDPYGNGLSPFPLAEGAALFPAPMQILSVASDFGPGHVDQFNVSLQQQLGAQLSVQAGYVGSRGRNLMADRQINAPVFGPGATLANAQQRRPILPEFYGSISEKVGTQRSQYDSLQLSATKSYAKGYTVQLAYTLSRSMDDGSGPVATGSQDPADPRAEWARSDFDRRHVLRVNGMWEVPRMDSRSAAVRHVLGGWRVAGIMSLLSGTPFTVTSGIDAALVGPNRGLSAQRPDLAGDPALADGRSRDETSVGTRLAMRTIALVAALAMSGCGGLAQEPQGQQRRAAATAPPAIAVDAEGTVRPPAFDVPYSSLASDGARRNFIDVTAPRARNPVPPGVTGIEGIRKALDDGRMRPVVERLRSIFPVTITPQLIAGIQTDIVEPAGGVSQRNRTRVLINLHGGGFSVGGRYGGQQESIPIASLGALKVITVDYRMGPEHIFPAASEDVAAVYKALLDQYRPEEIGIYGCSAGGMLAAQAVAWLHRQGLPRPGAVGIFGAGALVGKGGDSSFVSAFLNARGPAFVSDDEAIKRGPTYFRDADFADPLVSPAYAPAVLEAFPPTLVISGTRDDVLSDAVYTHAQLVKAGVDADLHVWEGATHCSFAQPLGNPDFPENRDAWKVIVTFFDRHLGRAH